MAPDPVLTRLANQSKLKRQLTILKAHSADNPISNGEAVIILERVNKIFDNVEKNQDKIIQGCTTEEEIVTQEDAFEAIERTYQECRTIIHGIIHGSSSQSSAPSSSLPKVRLPQLELPSFDGSYSSWTSFKDLFEASIDKNSDLTDGHKLIYLKGAVKGEAAKVIASLTITNANYKEAWELLNSRFNNHREIVSTVIDRLLGPKKVTTESPHELQSLLDNARECIRTLKVLKRPVQHWDDVIVYIYLQRVDNETRKQWALRQTEKDIPSFEDFAKFLENHIRGLLASGVGTQRSNSSSSGGAGRGGGRNFLSTHHTSTDVTSCPICKQSPHPIYKCLLFINKLPKERTEVVKQHHLCFNCLRGDHRLSECPNHMTCKKCSRKHHTMLHLDAAPAGSSGGSQQSSRTRRPSGQQNQQNEGSSGSPAPNAHISSCHGRTEENSVLLATALAHAGDYPNPNQTVRLLLDGGSQGTFISEECARRLNCKRYHSNILVNGVGNGPPITTKGKVFLTLKSIHNNTHMQIVAHILPDLTKTLPVNPFSTHQWSHLQGLNLADPTYNIPGPVDLLIDAAYVLRIETGRIRKGPAVESPGAKETTFGWVVTGNIPIQSLNSFKITISDNLDNLLQRFWEIEEPPTTKPLSPEEQQCETHFDQTYQRDPNGKFIVSLPFNSKKDQLGASRAMAVQRLVGIEKRLERNPLHKEAYHKFMSEYIELGHMAEIPKNQAAEQIGKTYYLPHHFVVNSSSTTTKLRVVFDGSARTTTDVSLNDVLMVGPQLQADLYNILLRFRMGKIVIKADMVKMFRQFLVSQQDTDFQRIVWRESRNQQVKDYRVLTVTYGTASAPYLSTKCLQQLAKDNQHSHPLAAAVLQTSTYVDDIMHSTNSFNDAKTLYDELTSVMCSAGVVLGKWATNNQELLQYIPAEKRETELSLGIDKDCNIKALGVQWSPSNDSFKFKVSPLADNLKLTKRTILSELAKVFDPLGLITPITIRAKMLMQEIWKQQIGWDDAVPSVIKQEWKEYSNDLLHVKNLVIPRWISFDSTCQHELHGFADSSERAYGAVVYLKSTTSTGEVKVHMITSKSRVTPIKLVSLPRLELCAAAELASLIAHVKCTLQLQCEMFCWSDSSITLAWISKLPCHWKTFVANKVAKIHKHTSPSLWKHVPGILNPADLVSRGVSSEQLISSKLWWNGPEFLHQIQLPEFQPPEIDESSDLEKKKQLISCNTTSLQPVFSKQFSSLTTSIRIAAYVCRFTNNSRKDSVKLGGTLSPKEIQTGLNFLVREAQQQSFPGEIAALLKEKSIHIKSKLLPLNPFINNHKLLCVGGRLRNANLPVAVKHQIILQNDHHLTKIIIEDYHRRNLHGGFQLTWASIQQKFWIVRGRDTVRHILRKCCICRRQQGAAYKQQMGNLPSPRVTISKPFSNTGVDYCGPFNLRNMKGRKSLTYKGYVSVFVCMSSKAVHLEAVSDLTTEAFIASLRRFIGRRGICATLYSDNATNFQGADNEIRRLMENEDHRSKVQDYCTTTGMEWTFIPPSSPHHGGLWEAAVKSFKYHLKRVCGDACLTFEQFQTFLAQVEAVMNSRPLVPMSDDPNDMEVLTAGHFLIGSALNALPDDDVSTTRQNRLTNWQLQQQRVQHFWTRWQSEYLTSLQQRQKWLRPSENIKIGDLVLIREDNLPPGKWKMGRVTATQPGQDGLIRVATVKTATSELTRAIVKLTPLLSVEHDK